MSSPHGAIDTYITRTLSAEQQAAVDAVEQKAADQNAHEHQLRASLRDALDRDDKKSAIKLAYVLMEDDGEDGEIDTLYDFLLTRVGVDRREPFLTISLQPVIQWASGVIVAVPMILLIAYLLSPEPVVTSERTDTLSCLGAALFFGIPLWDVLIANGYNHVNRHRLID